MTRRAGVARSVRLAPEKLTLINAWNGICEPVNQDESLSAATERQIVSRCDQRDEEQGPAMSF
jgi:hypothetical protein